MFATGEEFLTWIKSTNQPCIISSIGAQLILDYMDGHDYQLGTDTAGNLIRIDAADPNFLPEEYTLANAVYAVSTWNSELIEDTERIYNIECADDISVIQEKLERLRQDENILDAIAL